MKELLRRLQRAVSGADYSVPLSLFQSDPMTATNIVLRSVGAPQISDIKSTQQVLRAVLALGG